MSLLGTIGAIGGVVGGIGKELFGQDLEDERTNRKNALLRVLGKIRGEARGDAYKRNAGLLENARSAAAKRAGAQGRSGDAFVLPVESQAMKIGNENLRQVDAPFREAELGIEQDFANRPIEPNFGEKFFGALGSVGSGLASYDQDMEYLKILRGEDDDAGEEGDAKRTGSIIETPYKGSMEELFDLQDSQLTPTQRRINSLRLKFGNSDRIKPLYK